MTHAGHARVVQRQRALTPIVEVFVVLVDEMRRVLGVLLELLYHVSREELAVRFFDAPV